MLFLLFPLASVESDVSDDTVTPIVQMTVPEGKTHSQVPASQSQLRKQHVPRLSDGPCPRPLMSTFSHPGAAVLIYSL